MPEISTPNSSEGSAVLKLPHHNDHCERLDHDNVQLTRLLIERTINLSSYEQFEKSCHWDSLDRKDW